MNFLTSLIQRHIPAAQSPPPAPQPVLQPRLPSRFEPLAPLLPGNARDGGTLDEIEGAQVSLRANRSMARRAPLHTAPHDTPVADAPALRNDWQVSAIHAALGAARSTIQSAQPAAPATRDDSHGHTMAVRASTDPGPAPRIEAPESHEPHRSPIDAIGHMPRQPNAPTSGQSSIDTRTLQPLIRPEVRLAPPAHNTAPERERAETDLPAEPVVHVTIGRVEVRAVLPGTPPARPTQAPPRKPSLEDYLRGRKGGAP